MSTLYEDFSHLWQCFAEFLEWEMFQIKVVEITKTHFLFNKFFPKIVPFFELCRKNKVQPDSPQMRFVILGN
jgi:hypothetical protein